MNALRASTIPVTCSDSIPLVPAYCTVWISWTIFWLRARLWPPIPLFTGHGQEMHRYELQSTLQEFGYTGCLMRGEFLTLLRSRCSDVPLRFNTSVSDFTDTGDTVEVTLSDGTRHTCDLLVGADGIHSIIRSKLFGRQPDQDTGWGCWVWVARNAARAPDTVAEWWGTGRFFGVYPVKGGLGVVAAAPTKAIGPSAIGRDGRKAKAYFEPWGAGISDLLSALPDDLTNTYWWPLADHRSEHWKRTSGPDGRRCLRLSADRRHRSFHGSGVGCGTR